MDTVPAVTALQFRDGLTMGVGTSTGHVGRANYHKIVTHAVTSTSIHCSLYSKTHFKHILLD